MGCNPCYVAACYGPAVKTIIRIDPNAVDSPERIAAEKLPALAVRMLAEAYSKQRGTQGEALLVVDLGKDGKPVYLTIGSKPPELAVGRRRVYGVFIPPESQEPVATFFDQIAAEKWAKESGDENKIEEINSTDRSMVRVAVAALILHKGRVLLGKGKKTGLYVLPEGDLEVGESIESAVQRAVKATTGLDVGRIAVSKHAPYVSTFIENQHFLTLVMATEYVGGDPKPLDPLWESCDWFDAEQPPKPLFIAVQQIIALARFNVAAELPAVPLAAPLPVDPPSLVATATARREASPVPKTRRRNSRR